MFLASMDEAGNTGTRADPDQPVHMLGWLRVEDTSVRALEDDIAGVAAKHFPKLSTKPDFEFHGAHLDGGKVLFWWAEDAPSGNLSRELTTITS